MNIYKTLFLLAGLTIGSSVVFILASQKATTTAGSLRESYRIVAGHPFPKGSRLIEAENDKPPELSRFVFDSDYVVIASAGDVRSVRRRERKAANAKDFKIEDWMAGAVYPVNVESVLFSKKAFENNIEPVPVSMLETFKHGRAFDGGDLLKGTRYVLFLKSIPKNDDIFAQLELDDRHAYYRTVIGADSSGVSELPSARSPGKRGEINLSSGGRTDLVENIQRFCEALSGGSKNDKIQNLERLARSDNPVLRENAEYAIKYLASDAQR